MRANDHRRWALSRLCLALGAAVPAGLAVAADAGEQAEPWRISVGAGVIGLPEYVGSESTEARATPLLNIRYGRFFLGGIPGSGTPAGLGAHLYEGESLDVGVAVSRDIIDPRQESDEARLRGLGDVADDDYMRTLFGIDAEQAARSGLTQYAAGSGASLVRFSLGAQYELTAHWSLVSRITAARLQDDAADSPLVEDKNQNSYALFVTYRFQ